MTRTSTSIISSNAQRTESFKAIGNIESHQNKTSKWIRITVLLLCCGIGILPLFFGGKTVSAASLVKASTFLLSILVLAGVAETRTNYSTLSASLPKWITVPCLLLITISLLQLLPLPLVVMEIISSNTATLYQQVAAPFGFLSLEFSTSLSSFFWAVTLCIVFYFTFSLPKQAHVFHAEYASKPRATSNSPILEQDTVEQHLKSAIIVSALVCALIALSQWALGNGPLFGLFGEDKIFQVKRAHWPFVNPNHLSTFLVIGICICLSRLLFQVSWISTLVPPQGGLHANLKLLRRRQLLGKPVLYSLVLLVLVLANFLTASRMGNSLGATAIVTFYYFWRKHPPFNTRRVRIAQSLSHQRTSKAKALINRAKHPLIILALAGFILFFVGQKGRELAVERIEYGLASNFDQVRAELNRTSLAVIKQYPIFGVGLGCWHLASQQFVGMELAGWSLDYAHNEFLQLIAETGLLGAIGLAFFLIGFTISAMKFLSADCEPGLKLNFFTTTLTISALLIHCLVDFPLHIPSIAFTGAVILGLHLRLLRTKQN
jgi:hypothetical protein